MFGFRNFGKTNTSNGIEKLCSALEEADAVIIGAGAGLSTSAGFVYTGETSLDKGTQRKTTENELPSLTQCTA